MQEFRTIYMGGELSPSQVQPQKQQLELDLDILLNCGCLLTLKTDGNGKVVSQGFIESFGHDHEVVESRTSKPSGHPLVAKSVTSYA